MATCSKKPIKKTNYLNFAVQELVAEVPNILWTEIIRFWFVLGHFFLQSNKAYGRAFLLFEAKELQDPLVVTMVAVDVNEQDLGKEEGKQDNLCIRQKHLGQKNTLN